MSACRGARAGHGPGEEAERWAKAHDLAEGIDFVGHAPYWSLIRRLAASVDVLVHPALEESFSMAAAEAMALGIPVVAGRRSGGIADTVGPSAGRLVDVRSADEVAAAMLNLTNPTSFESASSAARLAARDRFRMEVILPQYERLYRTAADQSASTSATAGRHRE